MVLVRDSPRPLLPFKLYCIRIIHCCRQTRFVTCPNGFCKGAREAGAFLSKGSPLSGASGDSSPLPGNDRGISRPAVAAGFCRVGADCKDGAAPKDRVFCRAGDGALCSAGAPCKDREFCCCRIE